jgi:hypothetical protein
LDEKPDHESGAEEQASEGTDLGDEFSESVQLQLQWGALGVAAKG